MSLSFRWFFLVLLSLVVVGLGLRLQALDQKGMWSDELFTLAVAQYYPLSPAEGQPLYRRTDIFHIGDGDTFLTVKAAEQSPPLNDLLEKASVQWFGASELAIRLPAALAACVLLLWFAAFALLHPDPHVRRVLTWSLLLLTAYPALITYAKEGRAYSVGVSTVGMAGLMWMLRWRDGWREWQPPNWIEVVLFTFACYSHYNAAMLVALLLMPDAMMATKLRSVKGWIRLLTVGLVFSVWLALNAHTILFTSNGGVAWARMSALDRAWLTLQHAPMVMFPYWLELTSAVAFGLLIVRRIEKRPLWPTVGVFRLIALAALTLLYVTFAGLIAAKAGMAHPRFYIFVLPFVAVMMGLVFAELRQRWLIASTAVLLAAVATPMIRSIPSIPYEDFRSMTLYGVKVSNSETVFLYPSAQNRDIYRVYLERYLGADPRTRMVSVNAPQRTAEVCNQLTDHTNVVILAHDSGKSLIDAVYSDCGTRWKTRHHQPFTGVFTELWTSP